MQEIILKKLKNQTLHILVKKHPGNPCFIKKQTAQTVKKMYAKNRFYVLYDLFTTHSPEMCPRNVVK